MALCAFSLYMVNIVVRDLELNMILICQPSFNLFSCTSSWCKFPSTQQDCS
jgi:hypothetical protein